MVTAGAQAKERAIFEAAVELPTPARQGFIAQRCAGDEKLEQRVRRLVAANGRGRDAGSRIIHRDTMVERELPRCGPYRPLEKLGEGGMGVVYLAEQTHPVRRRVAIKIIKLGMDTKEVVARFESERQALAVLDHRHIARILEAGASDNGRPYFAMEYVPGEPIVDYCRRRGSSLRERLRLFVDVCLAMQHAHQKGIIHRDLKPSNILVMEDEGNPVPKIIDFGIAKATSRRLTDRTLHTAIGDVMGTPEYMSPEQANPSSLDVDTRSDVYSLGVILYELVADVLPFDFSTLDDILEMQRVVRENDPSRPSSHLIGKLRRAVHGELDWIVMTALAKARDERYQTAQAFAEDVVRFLKHEPVRAGRPGVVTRAYKLALRHSAMLAVVGAIFAAMVAGLALASVGLVEARRERDAARLARDESEAVTGFLLEMFSAADPKVRGKDVALRTILEESSATIGTRFEDRPVLEARLRGALGSTFISLGLYDEAEQNIRASASILEQAYPADHPERLNVEMNRARLFRVQGRLKQGERLTKSLLDSRRATHGIAHAATIEAVNELGLVYSEQGRDEEALRLQELELALAVRVFGDEDYKTLRAMHNVALQYAVHGRYSKAERVRLRLLELCRRNLGDRHPLTIFSLRGLGALYKNQDRFEVATTYYQEALGLARGVMGPDHPRTLSISMSYAELLEREGDLVKAESILRHTRDAFDREFGPRHPDTLRASNGLGRVLMLREASDSGGGFLATAVANGSETLDPDSARLARYRVDYAKYLLREGRLAEAEKELSRALHALESKVSLDNLSKESLSAAASMLSRIHHMSARTDS